MPNLSMPSAAEAEPVNQQWRRSLLYRPTRHRALQAALLLAALAGVSIMALDQPIAQAVERLPSFITRPAHLISDLLTLGNAWPVILLAVGVCLWAGLRDAARWILFALIAALASGAVVNVLKFLVGRHRPTVHPLEAHSFQPFTFEYHLQSLPSGHSADAAVWATVLMLANPATRKWTLPLALFFAFTRVLINAHWLSDIILGLTAGCLTTLALHALFVQCQHRPALTQP